MGRKLPAIPLATGQIPKNIVDILNPMREAIEVRFLGTRNRESAVTAEDLIKLGVISESDLTKLDN